MSISFDEWCEFYDLSFGRTCSLFCLHFSVFSVKMVIMVDINGSCLPAMCAGGWLSNSF